MMIFRRNEARNIITLRHVKLFDLVNVVSLVKLKVLKKNHPPPPCNISPPYVWQD